MKIIGHGIDIVAIGEIRRLISPPERHFEERCFTLRERTDVGTGQNAAERFAARLAAKEATLKALGVGFGDGIAFTDVELQTNALGAPQIVLYGRARSLAESRRITQWYVSTSHAGEFAIASVIAEGSDHDR